MSKTGGPAASEVHLGPLPTKFEPKLVMRFTCGRTKQVLEIGVPIPVEGVSLSAADAAHQKLDDILSRLGILPSSQLSLERENAQRNLQAEKENQKSA